MTGTAVLTSRPAWPRRSPAAVAGRGPSAISQKPIRDLERGGDSDVSYLAISLRDGRSKTQTQSIPFFIRIASFHVPFFLLFFVAKGAALALSFQLHLSVRTSREFVCLNQWAGSCQLGTRSSKFLVNVDADRWFGDRRRRDGTPIDTDPIHRRRRTVAIRWPTK